jgi:membrane peptidoglycan carboxypeptidase
MFRSCLFRLLAIPFAILLLLAGYEGVQVLRAKSNTPAALASVAARPIRLADLPQARRDMLLAVEDPGYYRHHGVDFATPGAGMTTITQGLVKRLYFPGGFKPGFAKIEQSLIAWAVLDRAVSKDEQLEIFINHASFGSAQGQQINGFDEASRTIYGRALPELSDREYLSLVAMLIGPNELDPRVHPKENARRVDRIEAMLAGKCKPAGLRDVYYQACGIP